MRLPLPIAPNRCGGWPGCGGVADAFRGHAVACPRNEGCRAGLGTGRAQGCGPRRSGGAAAVARPHNRRWRRRAGQTQPGPGHLRRFPAGGGALLRRHAGVAAEAPQPRASLCGWLPELRAQGPQRLLVLGSEIGGRWGDEVQDLAPCRSLRAPPAVRGPAAQGWQQRWWEPLSVAAQQAVGPQPWAAHGRHRLRALPKPPLELGLRLAADARWAVSAGVSPVTLGKRRGEKNEGQKLHQRRPQTAKRHDKSV